MKTLVLSILLFALAGCTSVAVTSDGENMVVVQNSGAYLFYVLPLCSGDPDYPNREVSNWFTDTVELKTNIRLLDEAADRAGATGYRNLASHLDDETIIPLILKRKIYKTSAELVR